MLQDDELLGRLLLIQLLDIRLVAHSECLGVVSGRIVIFMRPLLRYKWLLFVRSSRGRVSLFNLDHPILQAFDGHSLGHAVQKRRTRCLFGQVRSISRAFDPLDLRRITVMHWFL